MKFENCFTQAIHPFQNTINLEEVISFYNIYSSISLLNLTIKRPLNIFEEKGFNLKSIKYINFFITLFSQAYSYKLKKRLFNTPKIEKKG